MQLPFLPAPSQLRRALVRVGLAAPEEPESPIPEAPPPPAPPALSHNRPLHLVMSTLLTAFGVPVTRIDRRPSLNHVPFEDVYFVELEELGAGSDGEVSEHESSAWLKRVQLGIDRVRTLGAEATLIGVW